MVSAKGDGVCVVENTTLVTADTVAAVNPGVAWLQGSVIRAKLAATRSSSLARRKEEGDLSREEIRAASTQNQHTTDGAPFVINSAHQIYEWTGGGWARAPGAALDIAVGADGSP